MTNIAEEYAAALYAICFREKKIDEFLRQFALINEAVSKNCGYLELLDSPSLLLSERLALIDTAFGTAADEHIISFLKLLCENGHIKLLCKCFDEFANLVQAARNRTSATVYYAMPLDAAQKLKLCAKLEALTKKSVDAVYIEDKSLIGGIKVNIDGKTLDTSLSSRLCHIKEVMNK